MSIDANNICIVPVRELLSKQFFIPAYQRGYRWTKNNVLELLNDINSFTPRDVRDAQSDKKTWYCLQPLVVKEKKENDNTIYELIDGQQRITTIALIVRYINDKWRKDPGEQGPALDYETRPGSSEFIKNITLSEENNESDANIDYYYMSQAYNTIHQWWTKELISKENFLFNFYDHVKVIWYKILEDNPVDIFTRINMGKIPLTDAELIKALFLNSSNFKNSDDEKIRLRQLQISVEWDGIESKLHDEEFWYFLNDANNFETRIDLLFNIIIDWLDNVDDHAIFRKYHDHFKETSDITEKWKEVKDHYQTLIEWFDNRELYHKIGYLVSISERSILAELVKESLSNKKTKFLENLNNRISNLIPNELELLEYGDSRIRNVLLLHNIQSMLNNHEAKSRFSFSRYKSEFWDVEHIHSITEQMPSNVKEMEGWLIKSLDYVKEDKISQKIKNCIESGQLDREKFNDFSFEILEYLAGSEEVTEDTNNLSNLALLDRRTNRSYKNAIFPVKRETIIEREKTGTFIPICTKNVFMKFYNKNIKNFTYWDKADRENYMKDIDDVLSQYITEENNE